jgi:hypothetical protein
MLRQVKGGSSGHSQNSLVIHFGVGAAKIVDHVEVDWPSGTRTTWQGQPVNRLLRLVEGQVCEAPELTGCSELASER